jgi:hypothetical protein
LHAGQVRPTITFSDITVGIDGVPGSNLVEHIAGNEGFAWRSNSRISEIEDL